jgi:hypothetical protein
VITITPNTPTSSGTLTGTITVRGCSTVNCTGSDVSGSPKTINVTYTIAPAPTVTSSARFFNFQVAAGATPASQSLGMTSPAGAVPWSSQIAYTSGATGWLSLSQPSGTLPATVTVNATSMPVGVYKATITLNSGLSQPTVVPVSLAVNALGVNFVAPYIGTTSVAGDVIIRGYGFSGLTGPQVLFDATPATAINRVSDTEIRASYPALLAGAYPITVKDGTTTLPSRAQLVVVDPTAYVATSIARPQTGFMASLIYDAERRSIYLIDLDHDVLERYKFNGTNWVSDTAPGGGGVNKRMALSPDGTELVRVNFNSISRINPATLGTLSTVDAVPFFHSFTGPFGQVPDFSMIAFGNDGGAIGAAQSSTDGLVSLYRYDMLTQDFTALSTEFDFGAVMTFAPADASRVILPSFTSFLPGDPLSTFNPSDGTLATTSVTTFQLGFASLSRTGSRIALLDKAFTLQQLTTIYDSSFNALGALPDSPLGPSTLTGVVISPDGSTAYAYFSGAPGTVRKFDLNSPNGSGGFTEIGSGTAAPDFPGTNLIEMTISPDGSTLFLAGSQKVIVMPAP